MNVLNKTIKTDIATITEIDHETLLIDIEAGRALELKDYQQTMDAAYTLGGGVKYYNLANIGEFTMPDHEARIASISIEGAKYKIADAFIITTSAQKIIANLYINFHKPTVRTRFFTNRDQALAWIEGLKVADRLAVQKNNWNPAN